MNLNYKYTKQILLATALSLTIFGCSKQLDLTPTDTIDPTKAYKTVSDLDQGVIGAYQGLMQTDITNNALVSDELLYTTENLSGSGADGHRWKYDGSGGSVTEQFYDDYIVIDRANRVLAAMENVTAKPAEEAAKEQYKGELLALRAFAHFQLLQNFAEAYESDKMGVPYMTASEIASPARLTFGETMAKINEDLAAAKPLIPAEFDDNTRITKATVSAIQARVALYEKNWDNAATYATEAIDALPLASKSSFADIWTDQSEDEVFWKLKRLSTDDYSYIGDFFNRGNYTTNPVGTIILYAASYKLTNSFDQGKDIRFDSYITIDEDRKADGKTPNIVVKYLGGDVDLSNLADIKLFRTGEMYLIRAEAYAEKNMLTESAADLNELRAARINGYSPATFANKDALITAVYTERFKELAFEGHRFFDLKRRNLPVSRNPEDVPRIPEATSLTPGMAQYDFPIPNDELRANKNMKQNPHY